MKCIEWMKKDVSRNEKKITGAVSNAAVIRGSNTRYLIAFASNQVAFDDSLPAQTVKDP